MDYLRIGYLSTMYHTSHILKNQGWLKDNLDMEITWKLFGTGPSMVEAFKDHAIDIGYIGLPPAMIGIDWGIPLICIGGGHVEGTVMIATDSYSCFDEVGGVEPVLEQFSGKKIGSPSQGSIHDVIIRFLLNELQIKGVEVKNYPWADLIPDAIEEGEIDGAVGTPPLSVLARNLYGHQIIIPPGYLWQFNPSYGIVARKEMLSEEKVLIDFLMLHERACNLIREKPEDAADILQQEIKVVDSTFIVKTFCLSPKYCASLPDKYIDSTLAFVPALKRMGYLKHNLKADDIFDFSFIRRAHPEPHHYDSPMNITLTM